MIGFLLMIIMAVLPQCELEDGSTQSVCVWDGSSQGNKSGAIVLNWDYGKHYAVWER